MTAIANPARKPVIGPLLASTLSVVAIMLAVLLRYVLDPYLHNAYPLVTLFGAVAVAAWIGGWKATTITAVGGYIACDYLFIAPRYSIGVFKSIENIVGFLAYGITCGVIIGLTEATRIARNREGAAAERMRVTLQSIGDAVITTDHVSRITDLNAVAVELTGWTTHEAMGRPLDEVFRIVDETTGQTVESPVMRSLREGMIAGLANHAVLITRNGERRAIDESAAPICDRSGKITGCVLIFRDIATRRAAERERLARLASARLLAAIVESSDDAIISKNLDGTIQTWNAAAERLFGYAEADAVGMPIARLIPPDRLDEEDGIVEAWKRGDRIEHRETVRVHRHGQRIDVALTISPVRDDSGAIAGASMIVRDISEQRRMEGDLRTLAAELSIANQRKNEFIATLAHELRGPLAPLANMLEVMKRSASSPDAVARARETMERQLGQLVRLVDDLIDVNRITHDRLELRLREVDLAAVLRQAVESMQPLIEAEGHALDMQIPSQPIWLKSDPARLAQVFGNLLHNACKYTSPGGHIALGVTQQDGFAVISVRDNGIGIPPEQLHEIFEMFTQIDRSYDRAQGGLGIGLAIVRRLVELHGGTVTVSSAGVGKGTEFVVRLPVLASESVDTVADPIVLHTDVPASERAAVRAADHKSAARRILVADDNHDSAESLALLLQLEGHEVIIAHNGIDALDLAERKRPEIVLLDIGMPGLSGHDVCRAIRLRPWGSEMKIIALTGWGQEDDHRKSREAGFDGHLVKPADPEQLMKVLG